MPSEQETESVLEELFGLPIVMNPFGKSSTYPSLSDFLNSGRKLEIGYIRQMNAAVIAIAERNVVWQGKPSYESLDELLNHTESALADIEN